MLEKLKELFPIFSMQQKSIYVVGEPIKPKDHNGKKKVVSLGVTKYGVGRSPKQTVCNRSLG